MDDMSMHEILHTFNLACQMFANKFSPDLSDEDLNYVCHSTSCELFKVVAEVTDQEPNTLFQAMKNLLELEEE